MAAALCRMIGSCRSFILVLGYRIEDNKRYEQDTERSGQKTPAGECDYEDIWHIHNLYLLSAEDRDELGHQETACKNRCDLARDVGAESERQKMILLVGLDTDLLDNAG